MRRYRKNVQFQGSLFQPGVFHRVDEEPTPKESDRHLRKLKLMGIAVNPKLKIPVLSVTDGDYFSIRSLEEEDALLRIGRGYWDSSQSVGGNQVGMPRVHTPEGVKIQGAGYGTCLYSSGALGAYLDDQRIISINSRERGDGVCSDSDNRSAEATAWWDRAVDLGVAKRKEIDGDPEREEYVDLEVDPDQLSRCLRRDDIVYVNKVSVDIETPGEDIIVDVLPYVHGVWNNDLVAVEFDGNEFEPSRGPDEALREIWQFVLENPNFIHDANKDALLALDVRGLHPDAIDLLSLCYLQAGLRDRDVDAMRDRWENNLDPSASTRQGYLFPNGAGLHEVAEARRVVAWDELAELP